MTFTQLEYVLAVYDHRHFVRASLQCNVSQPTLSMQIQKLESSLGIDIFDRSKSPIAVTEAGEKLVKQARAILKFRDGIYAEISDSSKLSGEFRLGIIPTMAPYLLPLFIENFSRQFGDVDLIVSEMQTDEIVRDLHADVLDAGILATPLLDQSIIEDVLFYETFFAFSAKSSSVSKRKKVYENELSREDIWLLDEGHCLRSQVLKVCDANSGENNHFQFHTGSLETLKNIVRQGSGYTLLPQLAKNVFSEDEKKCVREFHAPVPAREVSVVYTRPKLKRAIREAIKQSVTQSLPDSIAVKRHKGLNVVGVI